MLAYHQACQSVYASKHKNLLDVWSLIETNTILLMSNINASRARFPFIYSVNELLEYEAWRKDKRLFFIDCLLRVLNKGYNTDTNCSVVLGMVGAAMGYHEIPSYYKAKIIEGQVSQRNKNRTKIF